MEQKELSVFELDETADQRKGVMPSDIIDGIEFFLDDAADGKCVSYETRKAKSGGEFVQYTLHVRDSEGTQKQIRFLMKSHLAPLARAFGKDWRAWAPGSKIIATGFKKDKFWDVRLEGLATQRTYIR